MLTKVLLGNIYKKILKTKFQFPMDITKQSWYAFRTYTIVMLFSCIINIQPQIMPAIFMKNATNLLVPIMQNGTISSNFTPTQKVDCSMPDVYIYQDYYHLPYLLFFQNVTLQSIKGSYAQISYAQNCTTPSFCLVTISDNCGDEDTNQINLIEIVTAQYPPIEYKVDCAPGQFYKPFEWGLFILIFFATFAIILSSLYSKAWSYGGLGIQINIWIIAAIDIIIIAGIIAAYFIPNIVSIWLKVVGSGVGTFGVMVCFSQTIYLFRWPFMTRQIFWKIRIIDIISFVFGVLITTIYWVTNGFWFLNDIEAVCSIVAVIKIFKIRSLKMAILLVLPLLLIEIIVGLIVHYGLETSYNNYVINLFESPIVIVFPSITPQMFRKCAWLPLTSVIMPGLAISYFRRFDLSRSTNIYLLVGWLSFLIGSIAWIFIDLATIHSLPFAIISQPIMLIFVGLISWRRNQFKTLWSGMFYDPEIKDMTQSLLKQTIVERTNSVEIRMLVDEAGNILHDKNSQSQQI